MKIARYKNDPLATFVHEVRLVSDVPDAKRYPSEGSAIASAMTKAANLGGDVTVYADGELVGTAVGDRVTGTSAWRWSR